MFALVFWKIEDTKVILRLSDLQQGHNNLNLLAYQIYLRKWDSDEVGRKNYSGGKYDGMIFSQENEMKGKYLIRKNNEYFMITGKHCW